MMDVRCEMVRGGLRCCLVLCSVCLMFCVHAGGSGMGSGQLAQRTEEQRGSGEQEGG